MDEGWKLEQKAAGGIKDFIDWLLYLQLHVFFFLNKKFFYKKMNLKNPKTLRKCQENLHP